MGLDCAKAVKVYFYERKKRSIHVHLHRDFQIIWKSDVTPIVEPYVNKPFSNCRKQCFNKLQGLDCEWVTLNQCCLQSKKRSSIAQCSNIFCHPSINFSWKIYPLYDSAWTMRFWEGRSVTCFLISKSTMNSDPTLIVIRTVCGNVSSWGSSEFLVHRRDMSFLVTGRLALMLNLQFTLVLLWIIYFPAGSNRY